MRCNQCKKIGQYDDISVAVNAMTQIIYFTNTRDLLLYLLPRPFLNLSKVWQNMSTTIRTRQTVKTRWRGIDIHGCYSLRTINFWPIWGCNYNWRIWRLNTSSSCVCVTSQVNYGDVTMLKIIGESTHSCPENRYSRWSIHHPIFIISRLYLLKIIINSEIKNFAHRKYVSYSWCIPNSYTKLILKWKIRGTKFESCLPVTVICKSQTSLFVINKNV